MRKLSLFVGALVLVLCAPTVARAQEFVVIVNAANPVSSMTRDEVSKIMLKKQPKWKDGTEAMPVDLDNDAVRDAFSKTVHGRPAAAIKAFWQQQLFAGKDVPPPAMNFERDIVGFVKGNHAAIGYVSAGTELPAGVKTVAVK